MPRPLTLLEPTLTDFIIFGRKRCPACGRVFPACGDWFHVDRDAKSSDGVGRYCLECRPEKRKR